MSTQERDLLTYEKARRIKDPFEKEFALRCLAVGCIVYQSIPISHSLIDFLVINPKRPDSTRGILVEVTRSVRLGSRKHRQIDAMKASGYKYVLLDGDNYAYMCAED